MLTLQIANVVTFFYPLGNTPAVSLTQALPPEKKADVLLLGSGDIRHVLFTVHADRTFPPFPAFCHQFVKDTNKKDRTLDFTSCDVDEAVIGMSISSSKTLTDQIGKLVTHFCSPSSLTTLMAQIILRIGTYTTTSGSMKLRLNFCKARHRSCTLSPFPSKPGTRANMAN